MSRPHRYLRLWCIEFCHHSFFAAHFLKLSMTLDIYLPPAKLGRKSHVLSFLADSKRQLKIWNYNCGGIICVIYENIFYLCGTERTSDKRRGIVAPVYDIDFFAAKFINYSLNSCSPRTYT